MTQSLQDAPARASSSVAEAEPESTALEPARRPEGATWWRRFRIGKYGDLTRPGFVASLVVLIVTAIAALLPGALAPRDPYATDIALALAAPSGEHLFGTDVLGRDVFSRFIHGASTTLSAAAIALVIAFVASIVLGLLAGYLGGWVDELIMRFIDILLALPGLLIALMLMTALGFGTVQIAVAVGVSSVASFSRVMRGEVLKARRRDFVTAAVTAGLPWYRVIARHVLPHALGPVLALTALELGGAVLSISALSFLGYGAPPPAPEWGNIISEGRDSLAYAWWIATLPGAAVLLVVLSVNRISRAIERVSA